MKLITDDSYYVSTVTFFNTRRLLSVFQVITLIIIYLII